MGRLQGTGGSGRGLKQGGTSNFLYAPILAAASLLFPIRSSVRQHCSQGQRASGLNALSGERIKPGNGGLYTGHPVEATTGCTLHIG